MSSTDTLTERVTILVVAEGLARPDRDRSCCQWGHYDPSPRVFRARIGDGHAHPASVWN